MLSDKNNLNHPYVDVLGSTNAQKGTQNGIKIDSGTIQLNNGLVPYPTKAYVDTTPNTRYRASILFFNDATTPNTVKLYIGSSGPYICDISSLNDGLHVIEMTYDATSGWQLFVDNEPHAGFNPLGVSDLYPKVGIATDSLEILEIKNQVFTKIDSTVNWSQDFNDTTQIDVSGINEASNDITHSIASSNREIIYVFNDDLTDIGTKFDDLYLWTDLDYSTSSSQSGSSFNPKSKYYAWNPPIGVDNVYRHVSSVGNVHQVVINDIPETPSGHDLPSLISTDNNQYVRGFAGWSPCAHYTHLNLLSFDPMPNRPYIADISIDYKLRYRADQPGNVLSSIMLIMEHSGYTSFMEKSFDFYMGANQWYYKTSSAEPFVFSDNEFFKNAISYTDNLNFDHGIIDYWNNWWGPSFNWLDLDWLQFVYSLSDEPITAEDLLHDYAISQSSDSSSKFGVLKNDYTKVSLHSGENFVTSGQRLLELSPSLTSTDQIVFENSFGRNVLSLSMDSHVAYPNYVQMGSLISATNIINDLRIVPKLNPTEGIGLSDTTYPYKTSWWHEQEIVSAMPFNLTFPEITPENLDGISDIIVKLQYNVSVANFSSWSWRPNLKIYDHQNDNWLSYRGDVYAYHDIEDKLVWSSNKPVTGQDEYDSVQMQHDHIYYFGNEDGKEKDNCTIIFKISKEGYDLKNFFSFVGGYANLTLLGLTYIIPGVFGNNNTWEITYDDNFDSKGRMAISSQLKYNNSYARTFLTSDVIRKNIELSNDAHGVEFNAPTSIEQPWIELTGQLGSIAVDDIARIVNVYGINEDPKMVSVLVDPTPEDPVGSDFYRFNRTEGRLYLPFKAILNYKKFNFTMELWSDMTIKGGTDNCYLPNANFENVTILENVIGVKSDGSIDYFTKNFEQDYSFYSDEPYFVFLKSDNSIDYIEFSKSIDLSPYSKIRAVVHEICNSDNAEREEKINLLQYNAIKFPFAITETENSIFLGLDLILNFSCGFVGKESVTNVLSSSDYDVNLDFYQRDSGNNDYFGSLSLEDYAQVFYRYSTYNLEIDLKESGLNSKALFECFGEEKELLINITASFKGTHRNKRLNGRFALEILNAELDADLLNERPSIDMIELSPSKYGVQFVNMTSNFMHNPHFADITELYGYDDQTGLTLIDQQDYKYGSLTDFNSLSQQQGTHSGDLSSLFDEDDDCLSLTSEATSGTGLDYILNGPDVPRQSEDFTIEDGEPTYDGDLNLMDDDNSTIKADSEYLKYIPSQTESEHVQYIDSITVTFGSSVLGPILNTYMDNSEYIYINSVNEYGGQLVDFEFNFDPSISGKHYYLSCHIENTNDVFGRFYINNDIIKSGSTIDFDNRLIADVTSISFSAGDDPCPDFTSRIYYFKLLEVTEFAYAEGVSDRAGDFEFEDDDCSTFLSEYIFGTPSTITLFPEYDSSPLQWVGLQPHHDKIRYADSNFIYSDGAVSPFTIDRHRYTDADIQPEDLAYKVKVTLRVLKTQSDATVTLFVKFHDGTSYSSEKEVTGITTAYQSLEVEWTNLELNGDAVNALEVALVAKNIFNKIFNPVKSSIL